MKYKGLLLTLPAWVLVLMLYGGIGYMIYKQFMEPTLDHAIFSLAGTGVAVFMLPVFGNLWDMSKPKP